jgi:putative spermidine/putrescine transport system ATP-binding protein
MLAGTIEAVEFGHVRVALAGGLRLLAATAGAATTGMSVVVAVRPEAIRLTEATDATADNNCRAFVRSRIYLGDHQRLLAELDNGLTITVKVAAGTEAAAGAPVLLSWSAAECRAFPAAGLAEESLNKEWKSP